MHWPLRSFPALAGAARLRATRSIAFPLVFHLPPPDGGGGGGSAAFRCFYLCRALFDGQGRDSQREMEQKNPKGPASRQAAIPPLAEEVEAPRLEVNYNVLATWEGRQDLTFFVGGPKSVMEGRQIYLCRAGLGNDQLSRYSSLTFEWRSPQTRVWGFIVPAIGGQVHRMGSSQSRRCHGLVNLSCGSLMPLWFAPRIVLAH